MQRRRIQILVLLLLFVPCLLAARLLQLQVFRYEEYAEQADRLRRATDFSSAPRGRILDRHGRVLAEDVPVHDVQYRLKDLFAARTVARRVSRLLSGVTGTHFPYGEDFLYESLERIRVEAESQLGQNSEHEIYTWIRELTEAQTEKLRTALESPQHSAQFPGLRLVSSSPRSDLAVVPAELFAGEVGIHRLEQRLNSAGYRVDPGELVGAARAHYQAMRDLERGLATKINRLTERINQGTLDPDEVQRLERRRLSLSASLEDPNVLNSLRQREFIKTRTLCEEIPFGVVQEVAIHPERFTGLQIVERRQRESRAGEVLGSLVGRVQSPSASTIERWRSESEPIVDSWLRDVGSLRGIDDDHRFLAAQARAHHSEDLVGVSGLERIYEAQLRGRPGARNQVVDARGRFRGLPVWEHDPHPGVDLELTVDYDLSAALYSEFRREQTSGDQGSFTGATLLAASPKTGEIIAWVSFPGLDPNRRFESRSEYLDFLEAHPGCLLNRPVQAQLEPGSTFKLVVSLAGLDRGLITDGYEVHCSGLYNPKRPDRLRCRNHPSGIDLDLRSAIAVSCNVFFYQLGEEIGPGELGLWAARELGLWQVEETLWPHVLVGSYPTRASSGPMVGIGRTFTISPIDLLEFTCAIARRGSQPILRLDLNRESPPPRELALPRAHWDRIIEGMVGAVDFGSARYRSIGLHEFDCAVKTGTADSRYFATNDQGEKVLVEANTAWIVGFAPVADPEIAFVVAKERALAHGAEGCGPIVAKLLGLLEPRLSRPVRLSQSEWTQRHPSRGARRRLRR